jgi:hypothetical protein
LPRNFPEATTPQGKRESLLSTDFYELPGNSDLSGTWSTSWLSVQKERLHQATLVIPTGHNNDFTASMVVTFSRNEQQTIVQETLTGSIREMAVTLTGVSYSYVQQGSSSGYTLDHFELRVSEDCKSLVGMVLLRHGKREVKLVKLP